MDAALRRQCERIVARAPWPRPWSVSRFVQAVAQARGRPLRVETLPDGAGTLCGLWVATQRCDYVFAPAAVSPMHREQIILHEMAHMLAGHAGWGTNANLHLPDIDPETVRTMMGRAVYDDEQEELAEVVATMLADRVQGEVMGLDEALRLHQADS